MNPWLGVAALCAAAALYFAMRLHLQSGASRRHASRARNLGQEGERQAERLLASAGYTIVGRQVTRRYPVRANRATVEVVVRADFLVRSKDGKDWVADAKGGPAVGRIEHSGTRRQLLEYQHAFGLPTLLVSTTDQTVVEIDFGDKRTAKAVFPLRQVLLSFAAGAVVTALLFQNYGL